MQTPLPARAVIALLRRRPWQIALSFALLAFSWQTLAKDSAEDTVNSARHTLASAQADLARLHQESTDRESKVSALHRELDRTVAARKTAEEQARELREALHARDQKDALQETERKQAEEKAQVDRQGTLAAANDEGAAEASPEHVSTDARKKAAAVSQPLPPPHSARFVGTATTQTGCLWSPDDSVTVSAGCINDRWPLTVSTASIRCEPGMRSIMFIKAGNREYALNGTTEGKYPERPSLFNSPIWKNDPNNPPAKINIGPLIDVGLDLCERLIIEAS